MADQYRARYKGARAGIGGQLYIDVQIDVSPDGETWDPLEGGNTGITLDAALVLSVTRDELLSDGEKLSAINGFLLARIEDMGLTTGRDAQAELEALLPDGWPVIVGL
jgi:hypothetical protein